MELDVSIDQDFDLRGDTNNINILNDTIESDFSWGQRFCDAGGVFDISNSFSRLADCQLDIVYRDDIKENGDWRELIDKSNESETQLQQTKLLLQNQEQFRLWMLDKK